MAISQAKRESSAYLTSEYKDLKASFDNLYKDTKKKDAANERLMKELISTRTSAANVQKELRLVTGKYEKLVNDQKQTLYEKDEIKAYCDKLEMHAANLEEATVLSELNRIQRQQIESLKQEIKNKECVIDNREQKITTIEYEFDCLKYAMNNQTTYENSVKGNIESGREMMRKLYYDLGKKQVDLEKLTCSLTEMTNNYEQKRKEIGAYATENNKLNDSITHLKQDLEALSTEKDELSKEYEKNKIQLTTTKEVNLRLQNQIEDISKRLSETRFQMESLLKTHEDSESDYQHTIQLLKEDNTILQTNIEKLQNILSQKETMQMVLDKKLQAEWENVNKSKALTEETMQKNEILESQLSLFRSTYTETLTTKEDTIRSLNDAMERKKVQEVESRIKYEKMAENLERCQQNSNNLENQLAGMLLQRDEAVEALQQCMMRYKTLNRQYLTERSVRVNAQNKYKAIDMEITQSKLGKEHAMNALMDALRKEKQRVLELEKIISDGSVGSYYYEKVSSTPVQDTGSADRGVSVGVQDTVPVSMTHPSVSVPKGMDSASDEILPPLPPSANETDNALSPAVISSSDSKNMESLVTNMLEVTPGSPNPNPSIQLPAEAVSKPAVSWSFAYGEGPTTPVGENRDGGTQPYLTSHSTPVAVTPSTLTPITSTNDVNIDMSLNRSIHNITITSPNSMKRVSETIARYGLH